MDGQALLTAIFEFATLIVFLYILYRLAGRTIGGALNARSERIETSLRTAEENLQRASVVQAETQRQLDQARSEAQGITESAQRAAETQRQVLIEQAQQEADALVQRARSAIGRERQAAMDDLRREGARLAMIAATRVVDSSLNDESGRKLADSAIADLGKVQ